MTTATPTRHQLTFSTEWETASLVRISVAGDVDASNAAQLAEYVFARSANCLELVVDLRGVDFFGSAGFTTLLRISERCSYAHVTWAVVASRAVSRVLDICDPKQTLPRAAG